MALSPPSEDATYLAIGSLANLAVEKAKEAAERFGFAWRADPDAPDTYDGLLTEFAECTVTGRDMRVSRVNAIPSVFGSARATFAGCFWRAATHIEMDADLGFTGSIQVAQSHLIDVVNAGMAEGSLPWQLMRADTVGQSYVQAMTHGRFVSDHLAFATTAVQRSLPLAVLMAVEQIEGRAIDGRDTESLMRFMQVEA